MTLLVKERGSESVPLQTGFFEAGSEVRFDKSVLLIIGGNLKIGARFAREILGILM